MIKIVLYVQQVTG